MAKVFPDGWRELTATGAAERELQTLAQFAAGLSDNYTVYHGVRWTRVESSSYAIFGEIDFAVVGPTGKVLLIEQKAGGLAPHSVPLPAGGERRRTHSAALRQTG